MLDDCCLVWYIRTQNDWNDRSSVPRSRFILCGIPQPPHLRSFAPPSACLERVVARHLPFPIPHSALESMSLNLNLGTLWSPKVAFGHFDLALAKEASVGSSTLESTGSPSSNLNFGQFWSDFGPILVNPAT